jgi:hypothetical protein
MARKLGQIIARGQSTWLVRVYLGRDAQTGTRKYHNQTIHGPFREAQRFLNSKLQLRENGPSFSRRSDESQPIPRSVALDRGQGASQIKNVQRLRNASPSTHSPGAG